MHETGFSSLSERPLPSVIYYVTCSLDGYIARTDGAVDWLVDGGDDDFGFAKFYAGVDIVVQGRKTYEQVLSFGVDYPYADKQNVVFSRTLVEAEYATVVCEPVAEWVARQGDQTIWVVGGGELASAFLDAGVLDRLMIYVQPTLLGEGLPLASVLKSDVGLELVSSTPLAAGLVELVYDVRCDE